jgi:uncharacterized protein YbjQ (UPF0145 family)
MIITTTQSIEGFTIVAYLGIVRSFREDYYFVGEEMDHLKNDLISAAEDLGADAIVGFTYISSSTYYSDDEGVCKPDMIAYGTAVKLKKNSIS